MIRPEEIRKKLLAHWTSRRFLKAELAGEPFFPLIVPFRKPQGRELAENFESIRVWLCALKKGSRPELGYGYDIDFTTINHRQLGPQQLPERITVPDRENFLRLINRETQYRQFRNDLALVEEEQPDLLPFFRRQPGKLLKHAGCWPQLLAVSAYFLAHPRPNRYLRELDIPGVDSKFIEQHRAIMAELLDQLLPVSAIDQESTGLTRHGFERRYFLKYEEPLIRFRILDPSLCPMPGLDDISTPLSRFSRLEPNWTRVFITENKTNGLSFPPCPGSIVVFGLGYGIHQLKDTAWLSDMDIRYWGDIDSHGFAILSRLRGLFPRTRSFLMDRATLFSHRHLWGMEAENQHCLDDLTHLKPEEQTLYNDLRDNRFGRNIRLEQERIRFADLLAGVA